MEWGLYINILCIYRLYVLDGRFIVNEIKFAQFSHSFQSVVHDQSRHTSCLKVGSLVLQLTGNGN